MLETKQKTVKKLSAFKRITKIDCKYLQKRDGGRVTIK